MTPERVQQLLDGFPKARVGVVGDFFLDKYLVIQRELVEISRETGLEAWQVVERRTSPGAAGSVTKALSALDIGVVYALGVIGDDGDGYDMRKGLHQERVDTTHLLERTDLMTPTYTKPWVRDKDGNAEEINRLDLRTRRPTPPDLEDAILQQVRQALPELDALIIVDQMEQVAMGVITDRVREEICDMAKANPDTVFFADSRVHIQLFRDVVIKPNKLEAAMACGHDYEEHELSLEDAKTCGAELIERNISAAFVTAGAEGMMVFDESGGAHIPAIELTGPTDICGAGDSTTAGIVSSLCSGATYREAGVIGGCVASITVQQIGTTGRATREQVRERFGENASLFAHI